MTNQHNNQREWEEEFDEEFLVENAVMLSSKHQFKEEVRGRLPYLFKRFVLKVIKSERQKVYDEVIEMVESTSFMNPAFTEYDKGRRDGYNFVANMVLKQLRNKRNEEE